MSSARTDQVPRVRRRGLRFADEPSFIQALSLLSALADEGPIQYHPVGGKGAPAIVLPEWSFKRLIPLLEEHRVSYSEAKVVPMSDLPPERQAQLRGLRD